MKLSNQSDYAKEDESDSEQSHNFQDENVDFKKFGNTVQVKASHNQFGNIDQVKSDFPEQSGCTAQMKANLGLKNMCQPGTPPEIPSSYPEQANSLIQKGTGEDIGTAQDSVVSDQGKADHEQLDNSYEMVESPNQEDHQSENAAFSSNSKKYCSQHLGRKKR